MDDEKKKQRVLLRKVAEDMLTSGKIDVPSHIKDQLPELLHEMHIHHAEIEIQNDELRKAQQSLEQSQKSYQRFFHHAPTSFVFLDMDYRIVRSNNTALKMLGIIDSGLPTNGIPLLGFIATPHHSDVVNALNETYNQGETTQVQFTCFYNGIIQGYYLMRASLFEENEEKYILCSIENITQIQVHQDSIERQRSYLEFLLNNLGVYVFILGENENITYCNEMARKRFACAPQDCFWNVFDKKEKLALQNFWNQWQKDTSSTSYVELWIKEFFYQIHFRHIYHEGEELHLVEIYDVTQKKRQERILDMIWDSSSMLYATVDHQGIYRSASPSWSSLGYKPEEIIGKHFQYFIHPDYIASSLDGFNTLTETKSLMSFENVIVKKNGSLAYLMWHAVKISGKELYYAIAEDITSLRLNEKRLARTQRLETLGQLSSGIAHDFNNIMMILEGHFELLSTKLQNQPETVPHLQKIHHTLARANNLATKLLAFGRKHKVTLEPVNLNIVLSDIEDLLSHLLPANVHLKVTYNLDNIWVIGDSGHLQQIIINLVTNARDSMLEGGDVSLRVARRKIDDKEIAISGFTPGEYVEIVVADDGCGIPKEDLSKVFEPFFSTKEDDSSGLGLATVYGYVRQLGGYIYLDSTVGKGTTVKIYFREEKTQVTSDKKVRLTSERKECETIFLVEDEEDLRNIISEYLIRKGYRVFKAESAEKALQMTKIIGGEVDLLITDLIMPCMRGEDLAEEMEKLYPNLAVICTSGYTTPKSPCSGHCEFLSKPYRPVELTKAIHKLFS